VSKFIFAPGVENELWAIWEYISQDNPDAATRVIEAAYETLDNLADTPGLGRLHKFRTSQLKGIRSWRVSGFDNYLIFFTAPFQTGFKSSMSITARGTLKRCLEKGESQNHDSKVCPKVISRSIKKHWADTEPD
jgi:toxin ParE1/3/4